MLFSNLEKSFSVEKALSMAPFFLNVIFYIDRGRRNVSYAINFFRHVSISSFFFAIKNAYMFVRNSGVPLAVSFSYAFGQWIVKAVFFLRDSAKIFPRIIMFNAIDVVNHFRLWMAHNNKGKSMGIMPFSRNGDFYISRAVVVTGNVASLASRRTTNFPAENAGFRAVAQNFVKSFFVHSPTIYSRWSYESTGVRC